MRPSRRGLIIDTAVSLLAAEVWEVELERIAGAPAGELNPVQRLRAVDIPMGRTAALPALSRSTGRCGRASVSSGCRSPTPPAPASSSSPPTGCRPTITSTMDP